MPYKQKPASSPRIPLHAEIVLRADGSRIELRLWRGARGLDCLIEYRDRGETVLSYARGEQGCERVLRGRGAPYAFRSIEQLRYDFERDIEEIAGGDEAQA